MYGCEGMGEGVATYLSMTAISTEDCESDGNPLFAIVFFGLYIFLAGFLMLNLFIGVIMVRRAAPFMPCQDVSEQ